MRLRTVALALAGLVLAAGCGNLSNLGKGNDEPSVAPSVASVFIPHVQQDWDAKGETIKPTAVVLHWWDGWGGGSNIDRLVKDANANKTDYDPKKKSTEKHPIVGHVTVQFGITGDGKAYQLTPQPNTFARHAKCANWWAVGIEIEGFGPDHDHYIGDNAVQFNAVVAAVKELMAKFGIKAESVVAEDGRSGRGVLSHKQVDAKCKWADNKPAGSGKVDVDDDYLKRVIKAVK